MTITYRNGVAVADLRDIGGPRQSLFTRNKDLARLLHNDIEQRVLRGEKITGQVVRAITTALTSPAAQATQVAIGVPVVAPMASRPAGLTLRKAFDLARLSRNKWLDAKDMHTIEANFHFVAAHFGAARALDSITTQDMRAYRLCMIEQKLAPSTINARLSMVSVLFKEAEDAGYPVEFPKIGRMDIRHVPVPPLSEADEVTVINYFRNSKVPTDQIMADLVPVLLDTGFRVSEALVLQDGVTIDWEAGMVKVRAHNNIGDRRGTAKGGEQRAVPMTDRVAAILRRRGPTPFAGLRLGRADTRWAVMRKAIGRDDPQFKIHALRHTCCNRLVQRGIDTARVRQWMGHKDIATTMLYVHGAGLNLNDLRDALQRPPKRATMAPPQSHPEVANQLETRMESQQLMHERI